MVRSKKIIVLFFDWLEKEIGEEVGEEGERKRVNWKITTNF